MTNIGFDQGDLLIGPAHLARTLGKLIDEFWILNPNSPNKIWTVHVKQCLAELGQEAASSKPGFEVETYYTAASPGMKEFLCDVVWWCKTNNEMNQFLAMASEVEWASWGPRRGGSQGDYVVGCVSEDFGKLLVFKCPLKVMVFTSCNEGGRLEPVRRRVLGGSTGSCSDVCRSQSAGRRW